MLKKVMSGGQTGVDRAGLDAAMKAGIPVGGYCPRGRTVEDGTIPDIYPLQELTSPEHYIRPEMNVVETDATLILNRGSLSHGTKRTFECTLKHLKPCLVIRLDVEPRIEPHQVADWIRRQRIATLHIAGPRESKCPGIYDEACIYLEKLFSAFVKPL